MAGTTSCIGAIISTTLKCGADATRNAARVARSEDGGTPHVQARGQNDLQIRQCIEMRDITAYTEGWMDSVRNACAACIILWMSWGALGHHFWLDENSKYWDQQDGDQRPI